MRYLALLFALLACASPATAQESLMDRAYAAIAAKQYAVARPLIEQHVAANPDDAQAWHQLAYTDESLQDYPAALTALTRYLALKPDDQRALLERGYLLVHVGKADEATAQFAALRSSPDPAVAKQATAEWEARQPARARSWDVFGYAYNESRFGDTFYGFDLRKSLAATPIEPYAVLHVVGDFNSGSGQNAQIFSDNAAIADVGLRARIASGTYLFAQGGAGFGTRGQGTISDLRYGLLSSNRWGGVSNGLTVDASAVMYSRYAGNWIGYLNLRKGIQLGNSAAFILGIDGALDSQRLYYNNFINEVGGIQVGTQWVKVRLEAYAGQYLGRGTGRPATTGSTYSSVRPMILFGTAF
ncbi:MAG: hypothetical protein JO359_15660 [Candidatus Eremiobacteraeota bacterium]|nr:hypothetical protein [Candidatus Eremiobacteraeota bacterium]